MTVTSSLVLSPLLLLKVLLMIFLVIKYASTAKGRQYFCCNNLQPATDAAYMSAETDSYLVLQKYAVHHVFDSSLYNMHCMWAVD